MPGNREVDRAAVQFGAFNLNGSGDEDVDGEREEPETRAQPPQHSPVAPELHFPLLHSNQCQFQMLSNSKAVGRIASGEFIQLVSLLSHIYVRDSKLTVSLAAPGLPSPAPLAKHSG